MPHRQLLAMKQRSARLSFFERLDVFPVPYSELARAVPAARARNDWLENPT